MASAKKRAARVAKLLIDKWDITHSGDKKYWRKTVRKILKLDRLIHG